MSDRTLTCVHTFSLKNEPYSNKSNDASKIFMLVDLSYANLAWTFYERCYREKIEYDVAGMVS